MDNNQVEIEIELDCQLLEKVRLAADAQGISMEELVAQRIQLYIEKHATP